MLDDEFTCTRRPRRPILDHTADPMLDEGWREAFATLMDERVRLARVGDALGEDAEDRLCTLAERDAMQRR